MFTQFEKSFSRDPEKVEPLNDASECIVPDIMGLYALLQMFGGVSFSGGLYRIVRPKDLEQWKQRVTLGFPEFEGKIVPFGYGWAGHLFALDLTRPEGGQPGVLLFDPGMAKVRKVPSNLVAFHNNDLMKFGDIALGTSLFKKWLDSGGNPPSFDQCIGYNVPPFLGGKDEIANLSLLDIDVYWHLTGQIIRQVASYPAGTSFKKFSIKMP